MHQPNYHQESRYDHQNTYERPPPQRITLDEFNSDLNFIISPDGVTGASMHENGFEYMWAGARATHGVRTGKVCFEVQVLDKLHVNMPETETTLHVMRIGWSVNEANLQVGEDNLSYGYGGTGKVSVNNKFFDYGQPYSSNDIITCHIDLDAHPKPIFYSKNGQYLGVAFRLGPETDGKVFYPHVTMKNMRCMVNFGSQNPSYSVPQGFSMMEWLPGQQLVCALSGPRSREECEIIMMVGLPGAGKTYWAEKYTKEHPEKKYYVLGTNTVMEKMKVMNLSRKRNYHGRWDALIKQATDVLNKELKIAERRPRNYILDQTNVYPNARRRKMGNFRGYRRIAAVVVCNNEVLKQRTEKREREEGKLVPEAAVMEMKANFNLPEVGQIFDDVWFVEEERAASERLVDEFQREGKAFKQMAGEPKRPSESSQGGMDTKKPRQNDDHSLQQRKSNHYQGHPGHPGHPAQHGPSRDHSLGPRPPGAYGAPNSNGPYRGPQFAQNGPPEYRQPPSTNYSRGSDMTSYKSPVQSSEYDSKSCSTQSQGASGTSYMERHTMNDRPSDFSYSGSYSNQGPYGQGQVYSDRYGSQNYSSYDQASRYGGAAGNQYASGDSYGGWSGSIGGQSQGYSNPSQGYWSPTSSVGHSGGTFDQSSDQYYRRDGSGAPYGDSTSQCGSGYGGYGPPTRY